MYKVGVGVPDRRTDVWGADRRAYGWSAWWVRASLGNFFFLFVVIYISCFAPFCVGMGGMLKLITS